MAYHLVPCDRVQGYLMPPSVREWLPEGDLAWFILEVVEQMDLKEFYSAYREDGWGAAAYDPAMRVGMLLYAYCQRVRSSRRIAAALERDVGFRVVAANGQPDFRTICRFRVDHDEALERLFAQVLRLCREAGLVKEGLGFRRFMRRGVRAASSEAGIIGTAHNLLKLWRSGQAPWGLAKARCN